jgi:hypothetical protein
MADDDKKGGGKKAAAADAAPEPPRDAQAETEPIVARPQQGRRWLTRNELETLRARLQKRFH